MRQHEKHVQDLKTDGWYREEINRNHALYMIVEERPPSLRRRLSVAEQVLAHARFADIDAELQQFAVNARRAPERILTAQHPNQSADLLRHGGPSRLSRSNFPGPKEAKALPVPADDGGGFDQEETGPPLVPHGAQPSP